MNQVQSFLDYLTSPEEQFRRLRAEYDLLLAKTGDMSRVFSEEFAATGCGEAFRDIDIGASYAICYGGIEIAYTSKALKDPLSFFYTCTHERIHALQFDRSAASHAHSTNPHSPVMLCPRDWVWMAEAMERDAFAKTALMCKLLMDAMPEHAAALKQISPGSDFLGSVDTHNIDTQIATLGDMLLEVNTEDATMRLIDVYRNKALNQYPEYIEKIKARGVSFVRLDAEDILAVGGTLGINSLGIPPRYLFTTIAGPLALSDSDRQRADALNDQLGIADESGLPTLREGLALHGMTPENLLALSRRAGF